MPSDRSETAGVSVETQDAPKRRYHPFEVVDAFMLTPRFRRVRLSGAMTQSLAREAPAAWIKLYPEEDGRPASRGRAYTIRSIAPEGARNGASVDLDMLVDHDGPLSRWASDAAPGMRIFAAGPGRGYRAPPGVRRHLLLGDASAIPAILAIIESLAEDDAVTARIVIGDQRECQSVTTRADLDLRWLPIIGHASAADRLLAALPQDAGIGSTHVWTAADVETVGDLRRHFLQDLRLERQLFHGAGYWKADVQDFSDANGDWN